MQLPIRIRLRNLGLHLLHRKILLIIRGMILIPQKRRRLLLTILTNLTIKLPMRQRALTPRNIAVLHRFFVLAMLKNGLPLALHLILVLELDLLAILPHPIIILLYKSNKDERVHLVIFTFLVRTEEIDQFQTSPETRLRQRGSTVFMFLRESDYFNDGFPFSLPCLNILEFRSIYSI